LDLKPGGVRANHYHESKVEHIYVVQGRMELVVEALDSGSREQFGLETGDLAVIQPRIAHAFLVKEEGLAIEFSPGQFNPGDIHRHVLVEA
jgi:quercetin dioxygenase-like cupin family protein